MPDPGGLSALFPGMFPGMFLGVLLGVVLAAIAGAGLGRLRAFARVRPAAYAGTGPAFDLRRHLAGPLACEGVIHGPRGRVISRFRMRMQGDWHGDTATLREDFIYASGQVQHREWRLRLGAEGRFTARADDIIGTARGEVAGAAARMRYRIRLPREAGGHVLDVTDWMFLVDNGVIVNRSEMRKFGIKVAELVATMRPLDPSGRAEP